MTLVIKFMLEEQEMDRDWTPGDHAWCMAKQWFAVTAFGHAIVPGPRTNSVSEVVAVKTRRNTTSLVSFFFGKKRSFLSLKGYPDWYTASSFRKIPPFNEKELLEEQKDIPTDVVPQKVTEKQRM